MRLLVVVSSNVVGGHEMQLANIVNSIKNDSIDVTVLCGDALVFDFFYKECANVNVECDSRFKLLKVNLIFNFIYSFYFFLINIKYIKSFDKVLLSAGAVEATVPYFFVNFFIEKFYVYIPAINFRDGLFGVFYNPFLCFIVRFYKKIILINKIQEKIFKAYTNAKVFIVRNFIKNKFPKLNFFDNRKARIVYIGRLDKNKNILELIEWSDSPGFPIDEILIFGDGPELSNIKAAKTRKLKVSLYGWMEFSKIYEKLNGNDIFVLNSMSEGEPTIIREMQYCGISVVCRDILGVKGVTSRKIRFNDRESFLNKVRDIRSVEPKSTMSREEKIEKQRLEQICRLLDD